MDTDRIRLAEEFLREAVYRSRDAQAARHALQASGNPALGSCGLGERAVVGLDLTPRGRELLEQLFDAERAAPASEDVRTTMTAWIEAQDAIDRKRNHFLKDFRSRHGFDRAAYAPESLALFEAGLARVNAEEDSARRAAAEKLLALER
jgi:hypothetical protein